MSYDNVNLWFAKDINDNIITIDEVYKKSKITYYCPLCGSELIPKATKSTFITSHFAHIDASKCTGESYIHFWFKNKFLVPGDRFAIISDEERQYVCKEILVEQSYRVGDRLYKPDVTVLTECGNTIYFEMDYSNKKKLQDYIDIWLELKNIVVEIDIKKLMQKDEIPTFNALFYNGKCFNVKKNDKYYNIIGKYKEELYSKYNFDQSLKERVQKLDWFWDDVLKYKKNEVDLEHISLLINSFEENDKKFIFRILEKINCNNLLEKYLEFINCDFNDKANRLINEIILKYKNTKFTFTKEPKSIVIDGLFKTRSIVIDIFHDSVVFSKEYWDDIEHKYWNGRKYKKYYRKGLVKKKYDVYEFDNFDYNKSLEIIDAEIKRQIEKYYTKEVMV